LRTQTLVGLGLFFFNKVAGYLGIEESIESLQDVNRWCCGQNLHANPSKKELYGKKIQQLTRPHKTQDWKCQEP